jgi:excisionase family DNA binding protein
VLKEQYSTKEVAQLVGRSQSAIRGLISRGELNAERLPGVGYRVPREAVLRLARDTLRDEAGTQLSDARLAKLIDEVISRTEGVPASD